MQVRVGIPDLLPCLAWLQHSFLCVARLCLLLTCQFFLCTIINNTPVAVPGCITVQLSQQTANRLPQHKQQRSHAVLSHFYSVAAALIGMRAVACSQCSAGPAAAAAHHLQPGACALRQRVAVVCAGG